MKIQNPTITIGIPAHNEEKNIQNLVLSLIKQKQRNFHLEGILVVSDGSTDNTINCVKMIRSYPIHIVENTIRMGKSYCQDQMIKSVRSDILVILDADIMIKDEFFLEKLIYPIIKTGAGLVSARIEELEAKSISQKILDDSMKFKKYIYEKFNQGNNIYTCHGRVRAFSKKLYRSIRFNNITAEDAYSYLFCKQHHIRYAFVKNTAVYYQLPKTFSDHQMQSIRFYRSQSQLADIYGQKVINNEYHLPILLILESFGKCTFKRPFIILYFIINLVIRINSRFSNKSDIIWDVAKSSKNLN